VVCARAVRFGVTMSSGSVPASSPLGQFLSVAPSVAALGCFVLPGLTAWEIRARHSTGSVPVLPFVAMATQCVVWLCYGLLVANATITVPNAFGIVLGSLYTWVYDRNSPPSSRAGLQRYYAGAFVVLALTAVVVLLAPVETAVALLGLAGAGGSVFFTASPLVAVLTVLRTRSTESMPLHTSLVMFVNGGLWVAFGYLVQPDPAVWVPNLLGTCAGAAQLAVHIYLRVSGAPSAAYGGVPDEGGIEARPRASQR
jgi:solute carrier family 50 protein (sugar transporter)